MGAILSSESTPSPGAWKAPLKIAYYLQRELYTARVIVLLSLAEKVVTQLTSAFSKKGVQGPWASSQRS
jgi:hypothetical protein